MLYSFFCHQKTIKKRQALHEIIGASSLSIFFYHSWKMYFQGKILTLDIFTHMPPPPSALPPIILQSQATMTWNIRLFYMICNFFECDDFTVL